MIAVFRFIHSHFVRLIAGLIFFISLFFVQVNRVAAQCTITIDMYDSWGDGWNNAEIDIYIGGSYYTSVGLTYGSNGTYTFTVPTGSTVSFYWYPGYWDDECYFFIDEGYNTLYSCYDASYLQGTFFTYTCGGGGGDPPVTVCTSNVVLNINGTTPAPHLEADGFYYIDVCPGQTINFVANAVPNSSNLTFSWSFQHFVNQTPVSQTATGRTTSFTPTASTGHNFVVMVEDAQGCKSFFTGRIRVSENPIAHITPSGTICAGSTEQLTLGYDQNSIIQVEPIQNEQEVSMGMGGATFIPDGPNCPDACYTSSVIFTNFSNTDVLQNASDLISVCINLEHTYADDLSIYLVCPNGSSTMLLNNHYLWRSGLMFGTPNFSDNSGNYCTSTGNPPGVGWNYCWSQNNQFSYGNSGFSNMYAGLSSGGYAFEDYAYNAGHDYTYYRSEYGYTQRSVDSTHLSSGTQYYAPVGSFSSLVGCPLNGEWQIQVCDTWAGDNGYVFSWELNFSPNLISPTWSYNVPIDHVDWSCNWATIVNDTTVNISPPIGTAPGSYSCTFTIHDAFGCTYSDQYPIEVSTPTITSTSATDAICGEPTGTATVISPNAVSYSWNTNPVQTTATATGLAAGNYIVTLTDAHGCTATASVNVPGSSADINLVITASSLHLCPGETATLTASGANSYAWNTGATTSSITVTAGTYTVTGNVDGCEVTEEITIMESPPMQITFDVVNPICNDPNGELTANVTGGIPPFQYRWSNGQQTASMQNLPAATYLVTVTDDYGCTKTASIELTSTAPTVSVTTTQSHCGQYDGTAILHISNGIPPYSYQWNLPETNEDTAFNLCAGTYSVIVEDSLCTVNFQFNITDAPLPTACFGVNQVYALLGTPLFFIDCSSPNVTWFWDFGDGTTTTIQNPDYIYPAIGEYNVILTVTDIFGCTNTINRTIVIYETSIVFVPNAFTPNLDSKNEVFIPTFYNVSADNYSLIIYNRWGEEIFRTTDINKGWDGTINGKPVTTNAVFVYVLHYSDLMGAKFMKKGTVTIVRTPPY